MDLSGSVHKMFRVAAATGALVRETAAAQSVDLKEKRRARYRANSPEVQDFYRVNRYPAR